jgi:hypothetical protein
MCIARIGHDCALPFGSSASGSARFSGTSSRAVLGPQACKLGSLGSKRDRSQLGAVRLRNAGGSRAMRPNGRYLEIYFAGCRSQLVFDNHNAAVVRFSAAMSFQSRSTEEGQRCRYRETRLASVLLDALFESPKEGLRAHGLSWIHEFTFKHPQIGLPGGRILAGTCLR